MSRSRERTPLERIAVDAFERAAVAVLVAGIVAGLLGVGALLKDLAE